MQRAGKYETLRLFGQATSSFSATGVARNFGERRIHVNAALNGASEGRRERGAREKEMEAYTTAALRSGAASRGEVTTHETWRLLQAREIDP